MRRPQQHYVPGEVVSRLLACHANQDYNGVLSELERYLSKHVIPECKILSVEEFSIQPRVDAAAE